MAGINDETSASYLPILIRVIEASHGEVLELGVGFYSTPVFHLLAQMEKRHIYSYEHDLDWYEWARKFESKYHHILYIRDWNNLPQTHFGVVFVDQSPSAFRRSSIKKYANSADYLVAHDTEIERTRQFHLENTLRTFRYRYDYKKLMPNTSVVSNFYDLKFLEND